MWEHIEFGKIADFKNGINFEKEQKGDTGIPTIDVKNMYSDSCYVKTNDLYRVNKTLDPDYYLTRGDLLFVRSSLKEEGVGWTCLFNGESKSVTFCGFIIRARIKEESREEIDPKYLTYFFRSDIPRKELVSGSGRVAITNINQGLLKSIQIPKPPLPEQRKIAHVLSTVQKAIEQQDTLIRTTTELKKALMQKLFTEGTRGEAQKETEIGRVPGSWEVVNLIDVCEKPQYGFTDSAAKDGNAQFLRITDITEFGVNWNEVPFCNCPDYKNQELKNGDIVFARIGATTGKSYLINNPPKSVYASYLIRVRCKDEILPEFLINYFETEQYWSQINARKGDNLKGGVNGSVLSKLFTPKPSLDEQEQIASFFMILNKKIAFTLSKKQTLAALFKTLLHELMTGQRRVHELEFNEDLTL